MIYQTSDHIHSKSADSSVSRLVAFCSGSKVIGKTWLASTIAHCLSLKRYKILFFDADCGLENISDQLNLEDVTPYAKLLNGARTLNNVVAPFVRGNFDIIAAPSGENALISAPTGRLQILGSDLIHFSQYYDLVFIDCADEDCPGVNVLLNLCQAIVLLVNPDPVALTEAYRKILRLKKIAPRSKLQIVINHAQSYEEGLALYKLLLKASEEYIKLDLNLLGIIRQDAHIREAVLNKELLLKRYPACTGAQDAALIGQQLLKDLTDEN